MKRIGKSANVLFNQDLFYIRTMSVGMLQFTDPDVAPYYYSADVDDVTLGESIRLALSFSRNLNLTEFQRIYQSGVIQKCGEERNQVMMNKYNYKNKRQLYRKMDKCDVFLVDGSIEISPSHHDSLDGWSASKSDFEIIVLEPNATDAELGAAIRSGFSHCTSSVK